MSQQEIIKPNTPFKNSEGFWEVHFSKEEVERLYQKVNAPGDRRPHVSSNSWQLADRIVELWFEEQGYDFWDNPYPDVEEMGVDPKTSTITIKYKTSE